MDLKITKYIRIRIALFVCLVMTVLTSYAASSRSVKQDTCDYDENAPVLIITSYNPETRTMADNLSAFLERYRQRGCARPIAVETMNCKNLTEAVEWKQRMLDILQKYTAPDQRPAVVILLGQEAIGSYLAQTGELALSTPAILALGSDYTIDLPTATTLLDTWEPACRSISHDYTHFNLIGGYLYHYDLSANLKLMRQLYPKRKHYVMLTDNTFGGLIMHAYMRQEMARRLQHGEMAEWLDGRQLSITEVTSRLRAESDNAQVMIGTWRIDRTENYVMGNITHLLREANTKLPAFSVSSVGIKDWAIGGYSPVYQVVGGKLADLTLDYLDKRTTTVNSGITRIENHYVFDYNMLKNFDIHEDRLPEDHEVIQRPKTFIQEHFTLVITVLCIILFLGLCIVVAVYYLVRIKHMNVELEQMSKDLIVARDKAEEANRLKTAFLANMSHEIRTPLNAIVGFSGVLVSEDITNEERTQFCDIIRVNSDLLLHLINDILDLSRIESGHMSFLTEPTDVIDLCKSALRTAEYARRTEAAFMFETKLIRLVLDTDGQRLQQVLINLLSNSAKFTPQGYITLKLAVRSENHDVLFTVEDTGCGIPPEKAEKIFERFEKLNEYAQGTGLGLSISRIIVERLGGKIWVDTTYDQGARFFFTLPLGKDSVVME